MQAGVPEEATVAPDPDPDPAAPAALADDGALVDEVLTFELPEPEADAEPGAEVDAEVDVEPGEAAEGVDDAAHPVASTPAAISGMASSAFFIGSTNAQ
ncbi:MAG TPA: hypothetical protein VK817_08975 [Trebonia sp.]|nr:hypothetical protein [Trebonia sp.]